MLNFRFRFLVVLLATLSMSIVAFAQKSFLPGSILPHEGDTVHGFIEYHNWAMNPREIYFRKTMNAESQRYSSVSLKSFVVNNEVYEGAVVSVEESQNITGDLKYRTDSVFLLALYLGAKSLYQYRDHFDKEQFYVKQDGGFSLLLYKVFQVTSNGDYGLRKNKRYLGDLAFYLNECKDIKSKLSKTEYNKRDLMQLFRSYYQCVNEQPVYKKETEPVIKKWGLLGGVTSAKLSFSGDGFDRVAEVNYPASKSFVAGFSLEFVFPRSNRKWSSYNELLVTSFNSKGEFNDFISTNEYKIIRTSFRNSYLKLNTMIRYSFPIKKVRLFANLGITNGIVVSSHSEVENESFFYSTISKSSRNDFLSTKKYQPGVLGGIGVIHKKLSVECRYESAEGVSGFSNLGSRITWSYIVLGYTF